ncbi:MAG: phytoene desaturase [Chloroflexi bacterium]|nr:phytoene desaturase [Chloroflexota bacterium]
MKNKSAVVIGAGIGGIASAARLARHGYQVTVVEKGKRAGGRCNRLVRDGHSFDTGPTLFLMPEIYAQTFSDLGERMDDLLDLRRVDPTYRVHFDDGSSLDLTSDLNVMKMQLEAIEPGSFAGFLRYLHEGHVHYELAFPHLVGRNFCNWFEFCNLKNLLLLFRLKLLSRHYDNVGNYFSHQRLKAAFTFQDMYLSLSPYEAPATYSLLPYAELARGVWFPMGGMARLVQALTDIAGKWGARFVYNIPVERTDVDGRQVTGVTLADGRQMRSDIVVANADLPYVYRHLLPDDGTAGRLAHKKYTCSTVTFYWAVDKLYPQLGPHNIFLADRYRQGFDSVLKDLTLPDEPSFYVHAPVRVDPSLAPYGQDTLMVVVPVGHIDDATPQDWSAIQTRARQFVLQRLAMLGASDLEEHIKFEVSYTPLDWQSRYNLSKGSALGLAHNLTQMGYLRPHNRHARYRNLYFVGASTHPGNGVATVLISARLTTERILQDAGIPQPMPLTTPVTAT